MLPNNYLWIIALSLGYKNLWKLLETKSWLNGLRQPEMVEYCRIEGVDESVYMLSQTFSAVCRKTPCFFCKNPRLRETFRYAIGSTVHFAKSIHHLCPLGCHRWKEWLICERSGYPINYWSPALHIEESILTVEQVDGGRSQSFSSKKRCSRLRSNDRKLHLCGFNATRKSFGGDLIAAKYPKVNNVMWAWSSIMSSTPTFITWDMWFGNTIWEYRSSKPITAVSSNKQDTWAIFEWAQTHIVCWVHWNLLFASDPLLFNLSKISGRSFLVVTTTQRTVLHTLLAALWPAIATSFSYQHYWQHNCIIYNSFNRLSLMSE